MQLRNTRGSAEPRRKLEGKEGEKRGNGNDQKDIVDRDTTSVFSGLIQVQKGWENYKDYKKSKIRMCDR